MSALDLRGHGESEKPTSVSRYTALPRTCAKRSSPRKRRCHLARAFDGALGYLRLLRTVRRRSLDKIVLTNEPPMLTSNPAWTPEEGEAAGSILTPASLWETANARVVQTVRQPSALSSNTV